MTFTVKGRKQRGVFFKRRAMTDGAVPTLRVSTSEPSVLNAPSRATEAVDSGQFQSAAIPEEFLQRTRNAESIFFGPTKLANMAAVSESGNIYTDLFTTLPPISDSHVTHTSKLQEETIQECLPFLSGLQPGASYNAHGVPHLDRSRHIQFIHKTLKSLPAPYVAADASRPWMFYWALASLSIMGEDISSYRERLIATARPMQNVGGGFGGGHGQMSHLAPSYAIVLSLAMVGGKEALDLIDRKAMWKWLSALKQEDGGFQMSIGGEEDVRGAYCAVLIVTILDLPVELSSDSQAKISGLDTLVDKLSEWVARCQTFEGGISGRPDAEAHGAYAFCALACLCILGEPHVIIPEYLDVPQLISWLSARQYAPEGGLAGRTNKLVDGCYSHWVGGCWPLLDACLDRPSTSSAVDAGKSLVPSVGSLYSREGLIRYILCCCQDQGKRGGLRDKPSHMSDAYHTCYVLAGLSSAQHNWHFNSSSSTTSVLSSLDSPYQWSSDKHVDEVQIFDDVDRVNTSHPVFVVPEGVAERTKQYFVSKGGF